MAPSNSPQHRPTIMGTRFMASATHYLAAHAAARVFAAGGNAVDAGVAAGLALAVVEPQRANLGGVAPILLRAADGTPAAIAGLGPWPQRATLAAVRARWGGDLPDGIPRTVVPAALSAYLVALERFGTLPFATVAAPARELAARGFRVTARLRDGIAAEMALLTRWPTTCQVLLPAGRLPNVGELLRLPELAGLLDMLSAAERGARRHGRAAGLRAAHRRFYQGDIAARIAHYVQAEGGLLAETDLSRFQAPVEAPARISFGGEFEVLACGPWCQGPALLQALKLLEPLAAQAFQPTEPQAIHLRLEALKLAFADREAYYGDPAFVDVPLAGLLSEGYAAERRRALAGEGAATALPAPGNPWPHCGRPGSAGRPVAADSGFGKVTADTTYVATADSQGNVFSATPSDPSQWGPLVPGLGILASPRGSQSWLDEAHPSVLQPGKRPRLTPNPSIVLRDGQPFLAIGTPGGDVQPQAMLQVVGAVISAGWDLQAAIEAARAATYSAPSSFWPHEAQPGVVRAEARLEAAALNELRRRGHQVVAWPEWAPEAGAVCAVQFGAGGLLLGGADPRRDAYAIGW